MKMKKISKGIYEIPKTGAMKVPVRIFASEKLLKDIEKDDCLKQMVNVAQLSGIEKYSIGMGDAHQGYGFCIGGVAAFDMDDGVISPGGIGYDINCGVRLLATDISLNDFLKIRKEVLHDLGRTIPSGVGRGGRVNVTYQQLDEILVEGVEWAVKKGFGNEKDIEFCEEGGRMKMADSDKVSKTAKKRGIGQLGTLGAGNHFVDFQVVDKIYDKKIAKVFGIEEGKIVVMIHCGSRGLGHQVASDYIKSMEDKYGFAKLPDRQLVCAPINSKLGKDYFKAMSAAANFAFCNRQIIMDNIRKMLERHFPENKSRLVYDVAHNMAKVEKYLIDGVEKDLMVIRKGATRSFGPEREGIPAAYKKVGQPVLIPGSMSTHSFVLVGRKGNEELSFSSSAHGAGRAHSRSWAHKALSLEKVRQILEKKDILLEGSSKGSIEESELSYKDIEEVIKSTEEIGLSDKVASLRPVAVLIG
ncbi:RNA-splicing ligase RtcB [Candidatus Pacearchaeota archaeon]|nr:RNA-splicing ligase RtcB [Candidatus Pacearchaeota archaeon]|tara:strand:- start:3910 stop:5322 length:1413 start_codon:yes stop_codon:yes gene_type:complete